MLKDYLKNYFIPHEKNDFKPDFLERASMGIMLVLVLLSFAIANIQALVWIGSDWMVSTILPAVIVDLTNEERGGDSLSRLSRSDVLDAAAELKAQDMAKNGYFAHYSPTGVSPWFWFDKVSYNFIHAGENLAVHFTDSSDVVDAWMNSPTHRANIMNGNFNEIGVGTAKGTYEGEPTVFVVQLFGTPSAVVAPPPVVAQAISPTPAPAPKTDILGETSNTPPIKVVPATQPIEVAAIPASSTLVMENTTPEASTTITEAEESTSTTIASYTYDGTTVMYTDLATTSREGVPATIDPNTPSSVDTSSPSLFEKFMTQPSEWLQVVYGALALIVFLALMLSIVIEWRRQNPIQIVYASGLIAVMALLFEVHTLLTGVTIV
ncbi:hypothetical protein IPH92_01725 [Candidatus Kaiserbacteria bacterium]|nr:MAG: hypothetical protein IPH92_01725 [Candidatus Kaiserbacteria bacterium]